MTRIPLDEIYQPKHLSMSDRSIDSFVTRIADDICRMFDNLGTMRIDYALEEYFQRLDLRFTELGFIRGHVLGYTSEFRRLIRKSVKKVFQDALRGMRPSNKPFIGRTLREDLYGDDELITFLKDIDYELIPYLPRERSRLVEEIIMNARNIQINYGGF